MYCPGENTTDLIWRVLASSDGISSWTPLKPQHSSPNLNPNPLANQLWCIDFLTPPTPLIIPHRLPAFLESFMPLKNMQDGQKAVWSIPYVSVAFFPSLKQNFIAYHSSKVSSHPDCIFEIYHMWQSGFSRVYSNCCYSCSFEAEIIKIGQSSHKIYSNNILNFQESTTILNACTKKVWKLIECTTYIANYILSLKLFCFLIKVIHKTGNLLNAPYIYIYIYIFVYLCLLVSIETNRGSWRPCTILNVGSRYYVYTKID